MSLEPIDCTSHSIEIEQEYLKIVRASDPDAKWLIISPNSQKEYYPSATGSDFSEFLDSFDDSKVQFGFARVSPPGSDVEKNILIGWCPDSAPMKTRASFASNFSTVANQVLKSYHVQVTARDSDDLDENELLMKISNAAGARYSIQSVNLKKQTTTTRRGLGRASAGTGTSTGTTTGTSTSTKPSTTAPRAATSQGVSQQKLGSPRVQGNNNNSDNDEEGWNEPELKERDFNEQPLKPNQSSYKPIGKVDLQKVIAEETAREDPRLVHSIDARADIAHLKEESREKRDRELESFIGSTKPPVVAPEFSRANRDDKVIKGFKTEKSPAQIWAERKAAKEEGKADTTTSAQQEQPVAATAAATEEEEEEEEPEERDVKDLKARFEQMSASNDEPVVITPKPYSRPPVARSDFAEARESSSSAFNPAKFGQALPGMQQTKPEPEPEPEQEPEPEPESEPEREAENEVSSNPVPVPLPPRHGGSETENLEEEEEQEEEESKQDEAAPPSLPRRNPEPQETPEEEEEEEKDEEEAPQLPSRGAQSASSNAPPPPPRRAVEPEEPATPWAVAEYDYEAGEDNELTFNEGDKIINIEFVDDDWWLGELEKNGEKGLFPSNYVTLHK